MNKHCLALLIAQLGWLPAVAGEPASRSTVAAPPARAFPVAASKLTQSQAPHRDGYLVRSEPQPAHNEAYHSEPYHPQPGDVVLYTLSKYEKWFRLAGTGPPTHAGIVFARPEGTPAILELTGPRVMLAKVCHLDVGPRLLEYPGEIMVRQPRTPLTAEQSAALTNFALAQEGDDFARGRLILQGTPLRCRYGLRLQLFGHTYLDRRRWICSEIVIAAAASAGMLDPSAYPANAMYPRDLAFDERYDLSHAYKPPVAWTPAPISSGR
jgi:hypothetical protein